MALARRGSPPLPVSLILSSLRVPPKQPPYFSSSSSDVKTRRDEASVRPSPLSVRLAAFSPILPRRPSRRRQKYKSVETKIASAPPRKKGKEGGKRAIEGRRLYRRILRCLLPSFLFWCRYPEGFWCNAIFFFFFSSSLHFCAANTNETKKEEEEGRERGPLSLLLPAFCALRRWSAGLLPRSGLYAFLQWFLGGKEQK